MLDRDGICHLVKTRSKIVSGIKHDARNVLDGVLTKSNFEDMFSETRVVFENGNVWFFGSEFLQYAASKSLM